MKNIILIVGAFYGFSSVLLGAFGAHALKKIISSAKLESFEVGVRYQMYHALFLLLIGFLLKFDSQMEKSIGWLAIIGTILFSGSIYLLATSEKTNIPTKFLGPITPMGGLLLLMAWLLLLIHFATKPS